MTLKKICPIVVSILMNINFTHPAGMMDDNSVIDLNDILSEKLMPASLFFMDNSVEKNLESEFRTLDNDTRTFESSYDGTFSNAYSTMGFHRKMMKEYLCSNFLAEQILNDVAPAHFQSRSGYAAAGTSNATDTNRKGSRSLKTIDIQESMRYDQGSSGYKDWLTKTATMDDIYRHIMMSPPSANNSLISSTLLTNKFVRRQDKNDENEYEEGDVTGYAMQHPGILNSNDGLLSQINPLPDNLHNHHTQSVNHIAGNKIEFPSYNQNPYLIDEEQTNLLLYNQFLEQMKANDEQANLLLYNQFLEQMKATNDPSSHGVLRPFAHLKQKFKKLFSRHKKEPEQGHQGYDHYGDMSYDKGSKEMGLKDLFDIALTTLAFLSFGMFILQVLMCITMSKSDSGNIMMMPMMTTGEGNPDVEGIRRRKRRSTEPSTMVEMNELSRKILLSIDAVQIADEDNGKCLLNAICENNKYSRDLKNNQKLWIPIWGLGLSWLSSKVTPAKSYTSILESLKASAFGLGKANCLKLFPCDMELRRKLKVKRRQTREASDHIFEWNI